MKKQLNNWVLFSSLIMLLGIGVSCTISEEASMVSVQKQKGE